MVLEVLKDQAKHIFFGGENDRSFWSQSVFLNIWGNLGFFKAPFYVSNMSMSTARSFS